VNPTKLALRNMRILYGVFLLTQFQFLLLLHFLHPPESGVEPAVVIAFAGVAVADVNVALFFRRRNVKAAEEKLRVSPNDPAAIGQWRVGMTLSFAFAETICLFGFMFKVLGAEWKFAGPFFGFSVLLMLLWVPRLDVPEAA
jgi:hypothetical protein